MSSGFIIADAIKKINSNAQFTITGNDIDTCKIEWLEDTTPISKENIKSKMSEVDYIEKRANEYPPIIDQLDDLYHNGIDGWKATIKTIKDKYPKE
tara:strand:- start:82 stop:369 length:288 start_codon:yes stop_codon:yes gene_type:complete